MTVRSWLSRAWYYCVRPVRWRRRTNRFFFFFNDSRVDVFLRLSEPPPSDCRTRTRTYGTAHIRVVFDGSKTTHAFAYRGPADRPSDPPGEDLGGGRPKSGPVNRKTAYYYVLRAVSRRGPVKLFFAKKGRRPTDETAKNEYFDGRLNLLIRSDTYTRRRTGPGR